MTASRFDLLPPNATQLERDLSRVTSSLVRTGGPVPIIRTAKRIDIPDSVVPWLIYEYGLGEILPYIGNNQRRALAEGILWQRIRGTPESIRIALSWIDIEGLIEESEGGSERWAEYQLGLAAPTSGDAVIDNIVGVTRISSPARSRLQRIYAVHDFRRAVYSQCDWSDGSIYGDHSGVRPRPDWPQISFGQVVSTLVQGGIAIGGSVSVGETEVVGIFVENDEIFRYGSNFYGEGWHGRNLPPLLTDLEGDSAALEDGRSWATSGYWGQRTWTEALPYVLMNDHVNLLWPLVNVLLPFEGENGSTIVTDVSSVPKSFNTLNGVLSRQKSIFGKASLTTNSQTSVVLAVAGTAQSGIYESLLRKFTIEAHLYRPPNAGQVEIFQLGTENVGRITFYYRADNKIEVEQFGVGIILTTTATCPLDTFFHFAIGNNENNLITLWIGGQPVGSFANTGIGNFGIFRLLGAAGHYTSQVRFTFENVYTEPFAPPSEPFPVG